MPPQPQLTSTFVPTPLTKKQWEEKYWFTSLQLVTVINPSWYKGPDSSSEPVSADYPFMVEMRHFMIKAGQQERLPGVIANVYLDQMSKIMAQNDDKLGFMADPALMKFYYDKLIVSVEDLAPKYDPTPAYLRDLAPGVQVESPDERAPWESNMERASEVPPTPPPAPEPPAPDANPAPGTGANYEPEKKPETAEKAPEESKERQFDYQGATYKMIVASNGHKMFYKNGVMISNADYNKAASML